MSFLKWRGHCIHPTLSRIMHCSNCRELESGLDIKHNDFVGSNTISQNSKTQRDVQLILTQITCSVVPFSPVCLVIVETVQDANFSVTFDNATSLKTERWVCDPMSA